MPHSCTDMPNSPNVFDLRLEDHMSCFHAVLQSLEVKMFSLILEKLEVFPTHSAVLSLIHESVYPEIRCL